MIVFLYQHNPREKDNWIQEENLHIQIISKDLCTGHECHLQKDKNYAIVILFVYHIQKSFAYAKNLKMKYFTHRNKNMRK